MSIIANIGDQVVRNMNVSALTKPITASSWEEAIEKADLNYHVEKLPLYYDAPEAPHITTDSYATVRLDTNEYLGIVSERYRVLQNREAGIVFDSLIGNGMTIERAGSFKGGAVIFLQAKLPSSIDIKGDIVGKYFTIINSHDGSKKFSMLTTPIRIICWNTLNTSLARAIAIKSVKHTKSIKINIEETRNMLGLIVNEYDLLEEAFKAFANKQILGAEETHFAEMMFPTDEQKTMEENYKMLDSQKLLVKLHQSGTGSELSRGTVWGLYNAATEMADHYMPVYKSRGFAPSEKQIESHLESILLGEKAEFKKRAFNVAKEMLV